MLTDARSTRMHWRDEDDARATLSGFVDALAALLDGSCGGVCIGLLEASVQGTFLRACV